LVAGAAGAAGLGEATQKVESVQKGLRRGAMHPVQPWKVNIISLRAGTNFSGKNAVNIKLMAAKFVKCDNYLHF
jgi:hypothetical protein